MPRKRKQNRRKTTAQSPLSAGIHNALNEPPQPSAAIRVEHHEVKAYSGPVPSPEVLEQYEQIAPGFAERLLSMAEQEQAHRHECERRALEQNIENHQARNREIARGQHYGLAIGLTAIAAGSALAFNGHGLPGGFIGTGGVIGLVVAFLYSHRKPSAQK